MMYSPEFLAAIENIAGEAGVLIARMRADGIGWTLKSDGSPVTQADRYAEDYIVERLNRLMPHVTIVAEERDAETQSSTLSAQSFVLVDALDGTKEYISGSHDYTVNIALIDSGVPVVGVVAAPGRHELYSGSASSAHRIELCDKATVRSKTAIEIRTRYRPMTAVVSLAHCSPDTIERLNSWQADASLSIGSSLKFCLIAQGKADIYPRLGRTMQWDTAAGDAILRAAGGCVLASDGSDFVYGAKSTGAPFANPHFVAYAGSPAELRALLNHGSPIGVHVT